MQHGTYVRGWKYDWQEARKESDALLAAGREFASACCADPGVTMCPQCGEHHWNEFEVYLCSRCGAEHDTKTDEAGPPKHPEKCRQRLAVGLRVRMRNRGTFRGKPYGANWPAGYVAPGTLGTIAYRVTWYDSNGNMCEPGADGAHAMEGWQIDWDGLIPKPGFIFGTFGPFLDDQLEVVT